MSTPCTTTFYEGGTPIATVYRHWDGYPEGHAVEILGFLAACEKAGDTRFTDPSYLAARFVAYLAERFRDSDNVVNFLSVGIVPSREWGCPNYTYEFHCDELDNSGRPRVRCYNGNAVEEPIPGIRFEAPKPELSIRDQIADAAEQGKPIGIHYRKLDSDRIGFTVEIREIVPTRFKEGASGAELVVAFDLDKQEPRTFRLDRIEGVWSTMAERIESYTLKVWRIDEWIDDYTDQISQWELVAQEHVRPAEPIILARCTTPTEAEAEDVIPRLLADGSAKKAGA